MDTGELTILGFIVGAMLGGVNLIGMLIDEIKWYLERRRMLKYLASGGKMALTRFWGTDRLS